MPPGTESSSVMTIPSCVGMTSGRMTPGSSSRKRFIRLYLISASGFPWSSQSAIQPGCVVPLALSVYRRFKAL